MLPGKKLTPADLLAIARRRIWLLVLPPAVTLFAALLYSSRIPDLYQSDMLIAIDPQRVPDSFVRSTVTLDTDRRMDALQVQVLSRTALQRLVDEFDLYPEERATLPAEDVLGIMRENISVVLESPRPRSNQMPQPSAFHIRYIYADPMVATTVTQRIGQMFVEQNIKDRGTQAGATNRFLETQLAEARSKLEAQERRLEDFRQLHGQELPTQMQSNMQSLQSAQLQAQNLVESIARDRDRKLMLERLYREASADKPATPVIVAQTPQNAAALTAQQQLAAARATLAGLELKYKPDHPDVTRAKRQVAELEPKAAEEARQAEATTGVPSEANEGDPARRESLRQMRAEMESLDRQIQFKESEEQRVRREISEYQRRLEAVPGLESQWVKLTRDYDTQQTAYRELLAKSTAAQVAANLEEEDIGERFRIVDPAAVPVHPVDSLRVRYNLGGFALGLLFGCGLALLLELKDKTFKSENDVLEVLGLPVLAQVPRVESEADRIRQRRRQIAVAVAGATCVVAAAYFTWTLKLWKSLL
jgi:polysaccharide chain length determinant protein (PEP-CTERM system associated)